MANDLLTQTQTTTTTQTEAPTQERREAVEGQISALEQAKQVQQEGLQQKAEFKEEVLEAQQPELEQRAQTQEDFVRQLGDLEQQRSDIEDRSLVELEDAYDELRKKPFKSFWSDKTMGDKVQAGLGLVLGGIASGLTGRANEAAAALDKAIDRDFQRQTQNYEKAMSILREKKGLNKQKLQSLLDKQGQLEFKKVAVLEQLGAQTKARLNQLERANAKPEVLQQMQALAAGFDQKVADLKAGLAAEAKERTTTQINKNIQQVDTAAQNAKLKSAQNELLQKEMNTYSKSDIAREAVARKTQYKLIEAAGDNGAGDMALIISFQKMLDPGSVVRETEFAKTADIGGVMEKLNSAMMQIEGKGLIDPAIRKQLKEQARKFYDAYQGEILAPHQKAWERRSAALGLDPDLVMGRDPQRAQAAQQQSTQDLLNQAGAPEAATPAPVQEEAPAQTTDFSKMSATDLIKEWNKGK